VNLAEKEKQMVQISVKGRPEDLELLFPDPVEFKFGGRIYEIYPLPIKKLRTIERLKSFGPDQSSEAFDAVVKAASEILNEPDVAFIEENLTSTAIIMLYKAVGKAETLALKSLNPENKKKAESNGQLAG